jgi:hypothetical protein
VSPFAPGLDAWMARWALLPPLRLAGWLTGWGSGRLAQLAALLGLCLGVPGTVLLVGPWLAFLGTATLVGLVTLVQLSARDLEASGEGVGEAASAEVLIAWRTLGRVRRSCRLMVGLTPPVVYLSFGVAGEASPVILTGAALMMGGYLVTLMAAAWAAGGTAPGVGLRERMQRWRAGLGGLGSPARVGSGA